MARKLTGGQRYLLNDPNLWKDMSPQKRGAFFREVRKKAIEELNEIVFLAQTLPEKQLAQIFEKKNMARLFDALLSIKGFSDKENLKPDQKERARTKEDSEKRRKRLLQIFDVLFLNYICNTTYVLSLAKKEQRILSASASGVHNMQALYLASTRED
jgi:hypothetical protein